MERTKLFQVLDALKMSIPDVEAYLTQKLNQIVPTPLTLVYEENGKFIYENQYNPAYKGRFIGFFVGNTIFFAQLFKCSLTPKWLQLHKINGKDLRQMCDTDLFPENAFLATSREKNIVYEHQKEWNETVHILNDRHIKMYPVKKIGGNIFEDKDRGKLQIYCAATNDYCSLDEWRENGTMMICSGKV